MRRGLECSLGGSHRCVPARRERLVGVEGRGRRGGTDLEETSLFELLEVTLSLERGSSSEEDVPTNEDSSVVLRESRSRN
jgi:hypothetical protein